MIDYTTEELQEPDIAKRNAKRHSRLQEQLAAIEEKAAEFARSSNNPPLTIREVTLWLAMTKAI
jgi:hypothetical protein